MTLSDIERGTQPQIAKVIFEADVVLQLFGSRLEDSSKGGGIDPLVETWMFDVPSIAKAHLRLPSEVCVRLGEQKIDLLIDYPERQQSSPIFKIARTQGGAVNDFSTMRLLEAWLQCEWHLYYLKHALLELAPFLLETPAVVEGMDDEMLQDWDQFILRFTKLQDAMGARLYSALLDYLQEPYQDTTMVDQSHRLESHLSNVEVWNVLRAIRNTFSHDCPQGDALKVAYLNELVAVVPAFEKLLARVSLVIGRTQ